MVHPSLLQSVQMDPRLLYQAAGLGVAPSINPKDTSSNHRAASIPTQAVSVANVQPAFILPVAAQAAAYQNLHLARPSK